MARYKMRQKLLSFGEDFTIEDGDGNPAYEVDGKVMTLRETFDLKDLSGNVVATIRGQLVSIRSKVNIERNGEHAATITKAFFSPLHPKFSVELEAGGDLTIDGSILEHEYTLRRGGDVVGHVSQRWFTLTDTYGIDIADGEDEPLMLAIAVALDEMSHDKD